MKLTICFDDASLSLPKMRRPDTRQRIIEAVLDLAAEAGVDDVHLIAALGLHRRMHEYELRHVLGDRIFDAFHPRGMLYQHDAEDHDNLTVIGETDQGEVLEINKRVAESRSRRLRQRQPGRHGRRLEVDHDRRRVVPLPQLPPQPRSRCRTPAA